MASTPATTATPHPHTKARRSTTEMLGLLLAGCSGPTVHTELRTDSDDRYDSNLTSGRLPWVTEPRR